MVKFFDPSIFFKYKNNHFYLYILEDLINGQISKIEKHCNSETEKLEGNIL